jgi:hypothetical protein
MINENQLPRIWIIIRLINETRYEDMWTDGGMDPLIIDLNILVIYT